MRTFTEISYVPQNHLLFPNLIIQGYVAILWFICYAHSLFLSRLEGERFRLVWYKVYKIFKTNCTHWYCCDIGTVEVTTHQLPDHGHFNEAEILSSPSEYVENGFDACERVSTKCVNSSTNHIAFSVLNEVKGRFWIWRVWCVFVCLT